MHLRGIWIVVLFAFFTRSVYCQWLSTARRPRQSSRTAAMAVAKQLLPHLLNVMKTWSDIPNNSTNAPMKEFKPQFKLAFLLSNSTSRGSTTFNINKIRYNKNKKEILLDGSHKRLVMRGNYKIDGKMFSLNIKSQGMYRLEMNNVNKTYRVRFVPARSGNKGLFDIVVNYKVNNIAKGTIYIDDKLLRSPVGFTWTRKETSGNTTEKAN